MINCLIDKANLLQHIKSQVLLPFTAKQLFDLVNDTESYPHFVPYCTKGQVLETHPWGKIASLTFGGMGLETTITTKNTLVEPERIELTLVSGPLQSLHGVWQFEPMGNQTKIALSFDYALSTDWTQKLFSPLLEEMLTRMTEVFIQEAKRRYD